MNVIKRTVNYLGYGRAKRALKSFTGKAKSLGIFSTYKRGYQAGSSDRLTSDWQLSPLSADADIKKSLPLLRQRSRDLEQNNDYAHKFLSMSVANVIGVKGIKFQPNVKTSNGNLDKHANELLLDSWRRWGKKGICTVDGVHSWYSVEKLVARSTPMDGEILLRKVFNADNPWRFALQLIEPDHLEFSFDGRLAANGNIIKMGVEKDKNDKPVAYHLREAHPGDYAYRLTNNVITARIPADEIIHVFLPLRPGQSRGVPWMHTAMYRLKMLGAYEEAETIAARIGASKMGFYKTQEGAEYSGDGSTDNGDLLTDMEPGIFEKLPEGLDVQFIDPKHPSGNFDPFMKASLRGIASGLNVSYVSLANNLEGVNFSSIRQGVLDERDQWRIVQGFYAEILHNAVYEAWLSQALLTDLAGKLSFTRFDRYLNVNWLPRSWPWVDPVKDSVAAKNEVALRINSRTRILAAKGVDIKDVIAEIAAEEKEIQAAGLTLEGFDGKVLSDGETKKNK